MKHNETVKIEIADKSPRSSSARQEERHEPAAASRLRCWGSPARECVMRRNPLKAFFHDLKHSNPADYDRITRLALEWRGRTMRYYRSRVCRALARKPRR